jgi:hypothetical protein
MEPGAAVQRQADGVALASVTSPRNVSEALPIFLRHGSPRILLVALALSVGVRFWLGEWSPWDVVPVVAIAFLWPLQEWLIHVFILHFRPFRLLGRKIDFRVPRKHREHHRQPWNYEILFIPMHSWLYTLPLLIFIWGTVMPSAPLTWTAIITHLTLTLHYEWVHFLIHTRVQPRLGYYQRLWRNHRLHHFKNEHFWYGVTRLEADRLLRTAPVADAVPLSSTCRDLHATATNPA